MLSFGSPKYKQPRGVALKLCVQSFAYQLISHNQQCVSWPNIYQYSTAHFDSVYYSFGCAVLDLAQL